MSDPFQQEETDILAVIQVLSEEVESLKAGMKKIAEVVGEMRGRAEAHYKEPDAHSPGFLAQK